MEEMSDYYKSIDKMESDIEAFYVWHSEMNECWTLPKEELQSYVIVWRAGRGETTWRHCHELGRIIANHESPSKRGLIVSFISRGRPAVIDMHHVTAEGVQAIGRRIQLTLMENGMDEEVAARTASNCALSIVGRRVE